jgi:hypothetical protein
VYCKESITHVSEVCSLFLEHIFKEQGLVMDEHQSELLTVSRIEKAEVIVQGIVTELFVILLVSAVILQGKHYRAVFNLAAILSLSLG